MLRDVWRRLSVLMATAFVDMVGFSILFSQLPYYAENFGAGPKVVGLLVAAYAVAQLATAPLWGRFSDRYGRRPAILAGLVLSGLGFLLFAASGAEPVVSLLGTKISLWVLLLSRFAQGAGGGTIAVVQAYVSDSSTPENRAKVLGWVTAATSAGVMIGPAIGSAAVHLGPAAPGLVALAFCVVNIAFAHRWLPESYAQPDTNQPAGPTEAIETPFEPKPPRVRPSIRKAMFDVVRHPSTPVATLIWTYAWGMLCFMSLSGAVLALYLKRVFDIDQGNIGYFFTYVATITLVMRALLLGPIVRWVGEVWTLRIGALTVAAGLLTIPLARGMVGLALTAIFIPIGTALLFPATTSLLSQRFKQEENGQAMGVQQAFGGVARLVGPLWSTWVFAEVGLRAPFYIAGGLMLLVFLHTFRIDATRPESKPAAAAA